MSVSLKGEASAMRKVILPQVQEMQMDLLRKIGTAGG